MKDFKKLFSHNHEEKRVFRFLLEHQTTYLRHYETLKQKYSSKTEIVTEFRNQLKSRIVKYAHEERYKFSIYLKMNPELNTSQFLDLYHPQAVNIIKFRLGSHFLPIETGRWNRTPRDR